MLLMLLLPAPAGLAVMLAATAWLAAETLDAPARPAWGIRLPRAAVRAVAPVAGPYGSAPGRRRPPVLR
jgi:hypothetical protein